MFWCVLFWKRQTGLRHELLYGNDYSFPNHSSRVNYPFILLAHPHVDTVFNHIWRPVLYCTSSPGQILHSSNFRIFNALVQDRGQRIVFLPDQELHWVFSGASLAVQEPQPLTLHLVLTELIDALVDEGGRSLLVPDCHLKEINTVRLMTLFK